MLSVPQIWHDVISQNIRSTNDTVSKSVSETVSHRSDDAKLIDKLKSQIKFITFVMQEYSKTYSTKDQAACNKALQTLDGRIHPGVAMMTAPFFSVCLVSQAVKICFISLETVSCRMLCLEATGQRPCAPWPRCPSASAPILRWAWLYAFLSLS